MPTLMAVLGCMMLAVAAWLVSSIGPALLVFFGGTFVYLAILMLFFQTRDNAVTLHRLLLAKLP